jgi:predicted kinase
MNVHIMRGVSGSGTSTYVKEHWPRATVVSADAYFINAEGVYVFDPAKLGDAHAWCLRDFVYSCRKGLAEHLVVDNTNVSVWEVAPYYSLALAYGHPVEVIRVGAIGSLREYTKRNVHDVPYETVRKQYENMGRLPDHWCERLAGIDD